MGYYACVDRASGSKANDFKSKYYDNRPEAVLECLGNVERNKARGVKKIAIYAMEASGDGFWRCELSLLGKGGRFESLYLTLPEAYGFTATLVAIKNERERERTEALA